MKLKPEIQVTYPKKINELKHLWIKKSKFMVIWLSIIFAITTLLFIIDIVIDYYAFAQFWDNTSFLVYMIIFYIIFALPTLFLFSIYLHIYLTKEINRSHWPTSLCSVINFACLFLLMMSILGMFSLQTNLVLSFTSQYANVPIYGRILISKVETIVYILLYANFALMLLLIVNTAINVLMGSKFAYYRRSIWNNYNSKFQWIDSKKSKTKVNNPEEKPKS